MSYSVEQIEGYAIKRREKPIVKKNRYEFTKVGIVGCGILGQEITRMVSSHGIEVTFVEISEEKCSMTSLAMLTYEIKKMHQAS